MGPLQNLTLCWQGRSPPAHPLPLHKAPAVHLAMAQLYAPWANCLLASSFANAAALALEPILRQRFVCLPADPSAVARNWMLC